MGFLMRLSDHEQQSIIAAVKANLSCSAKVWLFGSRCNDQARGGDIDLYIESPALADLFQRKLQLKLALEDALGEQKIDVLVHQYGTPLLPIHTLAKDTGIRLNDV